MPSTATMSGRIPARDLLAPEELAVLRRRVEWKGVALVAHAWAVILGSVTLVAVFPNLLTYVLAVMLVGSRQLGLTILMHDGAHGGSPAARGATRR
jgi:fatty acid desaturase